MASYNNRGAVTLEGVVVALPDAREAHANLRLRAESLETHDDGNTRPVYGLVLVQAPLFPRLHYGDRLRVAGALESPPVFADFSYRDYLARQGIRSELRYGAAEVVARRQCAALGRADCNPILQGVYDFKARSLETIGLLFPEPQAALLSGILLGVESSIPGSLQEAFRATGTSHLIAISGFNVSIVAGAFIFLSRRIAGPYARRRSALLAITAIALFTLLVGAEASVVRAAIMASLALVAHLLGRQVFAPGALLGTALLMTLFNPNVLWDLGFQLSFMATLGLVLYAEPVSRALTSLLSRLTPLAADRRVAGFTGDFVGLTQAAQITTLPLTAFYFGRFSLISLVANTLVLPAQPAVMVLGSLAALAGQVWLPLGTFFAWLAWPFVTFTIAVVEWLARAPGGSVYFGWGSPGWLVGLYGLIFGVTWLAGRRSQAEAGDAAAPRPGPTRWQRHGATVLLGLLAVGAALIWSAVFALPDGRLHLTFLDVGQGEAVLVRTPSGEFVLIGGGPGGVRLAEGLGRWMPFWQRRLALVVAPGPLDDQLTGLAAVVPRYEVEQVLITGGSGRSFAFRDLMGGLNRRAVPILQAEAGQAFDLGDGARLNVLSVGEAGLVVRISWGNASFLLPLGQADDQLAALAAEDLTSNVLLVPERGGAGALELEFVEAVSPWATVISVDVEGPAPETLRALAGYTVLRTDRNGWVSFATDGDQLWTETER